jgi:DNA primase
VKDRFFNRVMFPIGDLQGRIIAFGGRVIGDGQPKYLNSSDTPIFHKSQNLYAIDRAKNEIVATGTAVVVEGYTDVIALHEAGVRNAVATLGTALTARHVKLLGRFAKRIVYLFDGDEAGMRAAEKAAEFLQLSETPEAGTTGIELRVAVVPAGMDPADYAEKAGGDGVRSLIGDAEPLLRFVIDRGLESHDLKSPEGRSRALASAAAILASVRGSILGQDYANYVADRLRVDYATVDRAMKAAKPHYDGGALAADEAAVRAAQPARPAARPLDASRAEEELIRQIVSAPQLRGRVRDLLATDNALSDPASAMLAGALVASGNLTGKDLFAAVSARDRSVAEQLSTYLVEPMEEADALARFDETLARLTGFALQREIVRLQADMRDADPVKDSQGYDELFRKAADLQRKLQELRAGTSDG